MQVATVYLITNLVNGHTYVGITRGTVAYRWTRHAYIAKTKPKTYLHRAIAKYGEGNFNICAIASCLNIDELSKTERDVIKSFAPTYNQTNGGEITVGKRVAPEVIAKIKASNTGKKRTAEQNMRNSTQAKARVESRPELKAEYTQRILAARAKIEEPKRIAAIRAIKQKAVVCTTLGISFESIRSAAEFCKVHEASVSYVCSGKYKSVRGLHFKLV